MLLPPVNGHIQFLNRSFDQLIKLTLILPLSAQEEMSLWEQDHFHKI